ncbi:MAG: hypothetical protein WAS36_02940 [Candidatus Saccharimonadales bacterium]
MSPNHDPGSRVLGYLDSPPPFFDRQTSDKRNLIFAYGTLAFISGVAVANLITTNVQSSEEPTGSSNQIPIVRQQFPSQQEISPGDTITIPPTTPSSP